MSFYGERFPRRSRNAELVGMIRDYMASMQGFSIPIRGGTTPTKGWAVSLAGNETVYEDMPSYDNLTLDVLRKLRAQHDYPIYLGGWYSNGRYYLDVSRIIDDYNEAMVIASENNQLAIYNLETGETVYTNKVVA
jgi:hypothetical protein